MKHKYMSIVYLLCELRPLNVQQTGAIKGLINANKYKVSIMIKEDQIVQSEPTCDWRRFFMMKDVV